MLENVVIGVGVAYNVTTNGGGCISMQKIVLVSAFIASKSQNITLLFSSWFRWF